MDQFVLGWSSAMDHWLSDATKSGVRITAKHKNMYQGLTKEGQLLNCHLSGRLLHIAATSTELPAVGDWCVAGTRFTDATNGPAAVIEQLIPRRSEITRMAAGTGAEAQVVAANVDFAFIVTAVTRDFNINRLRRFVLLAEHGRVTPVFVLSKIDLATDGGAECVHAVKETFPHYQCIATSAQDMTGFAQITALLRDGKTGVFLGSSGVGKSTLVNGLLDADVQKTRALREHTQKGIHTTTASGLFFVPEGGIIIDTPGLREVGLVADADDLGRVMPGVISVANACQFRDCLHSTEPGCAVLAALASGELSESEYETYSSLQREMAHSRRKLDVKAASEERKRWKKITMDNRRRYVERDRARE